MQMRTWYITPKRDVSAESRNLLFWETTDNISETVLDRDIDIVVM